MKRYVFLIIFILLFSFRVFAVQFNGTPTNYTVTMNRVELYNSTTSTWVEVASGDQSFNIASVNAGQSVGSYISSAPIPEGVYTQIRVRISRTMNLQCQRTFGANTYYTTTTQQAIGSGGRAVVINTTEGSPQLGTIYIPTGQPPSPPAYLVSHTIDGTYFVEVMNLSTNITVIQGLSNTVAVQFDVTNSVTFDNVLNISWCNPPTVTLDIQ